MHGGRERSIGVHNPDATAWDTVNPLYPDAESWKRRPRNGTIPENFPGAFDFETPPRSPPPEREMAFDFADAGGEGYVARWPEDRRKREPVSFLPVQTRTYVLCGGGAPGGRAGPGRTR